MRGGTFVFFALFSLWLCAPSILYAADSDVVITEIGGHEKSDHEWIEILNKGSSSVDLTGWRFFEDDTNHLLSAYRGDLILEPGEYAVIADVAATTAADYPSFVGTLIDSAWTTLSDNGESIGMRNKTGTLVESFTYRSFSKFSLERVDPASNDYSATNWKEHLSGSTIGKANTASAVSDSSPATAPTQSIFYPVLPSPSWRPIAGDVVINEVLPHPKDGEDEWIELYNATTFDINLAGWTLEDGSDAKTRIVGTMAPSGKERFFVIEKPVGTLNNDGDILTLRDSFGTVIDQLVFGSWDDGKIDDNLPAALQEHALARVKDGATTRDPERDVVTTKTPTKGAPNAITSVARPAAAEPPKKPLEPKAPTGAASIIINELVPNPVTQKASDEYIELYNSGSADVDLEGWALQASVGKRFTIHASSSTQAYIIKPKGFIHFTREQTRLMLKNEGGDAVKLYRPDRETAVDSVVYRDEAQSGWAYARKEDGSFDWTAVPTQGGANTIPNRNHIPLLYVVVPKEGVVESEVVFDASDSVDEDGDRLSVEWDTGDGQTLQGMYVAHAYRREGTYAVVARIFDGTSTVTEEKKIAIRELPESQRPIAEIPMNVLAINEIFPNPNGRDADEFIEIKNMSSQTISLGGALLQLGDGRVLYQFPSDAAITNELLVVRQKDFSRQLRNKEEAIRLVSSGRVLDEISFQDAPPGTSFSRMPGGLVKWSENPSPGKENMDAKNAVTPQSAVKKSAVRSAVANSRSVNGTRGVRDALALPSRAKVFVSGVVVAAPGTFGKTAFYIQDGSGGARVSLPSGFQAKMSVGDSVSFVATVGTLQGKPILRLPKGGALAMRKGAIPSISGATIADLDEQHIHTLIRVKGIIKELSWPHMIIDDNTGELAVAISRTTGIQKRLLSDGDEVEIAGILRDDDDSFSLSPRFDDDIVVASSSLATGVTEIPANNEDVTRFIQYFTVSMIVLTLALLTVVVKKNHS